MTTHTDNFTGTDGQLLTARSGWSQRGSGDCRAAVNASNQLKGIAGGNASAVGTDTGTANMYAQCVARANFGSEDSFPLVVRMTDRNDFIGARYVPSTSLWEIYLNNGRLASVSGSYASGDLIRFEVDASHNLTLKKNGTTILTAVDFVPFTATYAGIYLRSAHDPVMDDWESGTLTSGSPPVVSLSTQLITGQELSLIGTYTESATSGFAFLPAASVPNGAVDVGPVPLTYAAGSWSVNFSGLAPGDYDPPEITMANGAGSDTELGSAFTVMAISGTPEAPNPGETIESTNVVDAAASSVATGVLGTVVEAGSVAEQQAAGLETSRAVDETGTAADVAQKTVTSSSLLAEASAASDAASSAAALARSQGDSATAAESQSSSATKAATTSEVGAATDVQDGATALGNIEVQDSATAAELSAAVAGAARNTPEAAVAIDTQGSALGVSVVRQDVAVAQDTLAGLVVMGVATLESLVGLADSGSGLVGTIQGDVSEVLVLTEQQFQFLVVARGVLEVVVVDDAATSAPVLTPTTVVDTINVVDLVARLAYARPPQAGSAATRRFIVYYK